MLTSYDVHNKIQLYYKHSLLEILIIYHYIDIEVHFIRIFISPFAPHIYLIYCLIDKFYIKYKSIE